jgi:L,D-transpeptidase ErfK/SrfK
MGIFALYLGWPHYAIHDTNKPDSVGRRGSDGCLRLYREDAEELFPLAEPGTAVHVVDQPVKTGWRAGELYLEVHPGQVDADAVETGGRASSPPPSGVEELVAQAAGSDVERVDWYAVGLAALERRGVPIRVTLAPRAAAR